MQHHDGNARKKRRLNPPETEPFVLRSVLENIPLAKEDGSQSVSISCVEYWNSNLYIGTSASEILHFVSLPSDSGDHANSPTFILASRLQPSGYGFAPPAQQPVGVRQILVLPGPSKACILCNGVVSFYSLPELTPAFPNKEPTGVQWIGGIDENGDKDNPDGSVVMIANSKRILLVRVGEKLRPIKNNIEYPGCLRSSRRDTVACVADKSSYALLEVEHQQKIPLFPILSNSGADIDPPSENDRKTQQVSQPLNAIPTRHDRSEGVGHNRSTSLGNFMGTVSNRQPNTESQRRDLGPVGSSIASSVSGERVEEKGDPSAVSITRPRSSTDAQSQISAQGALNRKPTVSLQPHILSPSPTEFILTTGSGKHDPGVGIFVNLDGDVVRGTMEFESYPDALSIDRRVTNQHSPLQSEDDQDDVILALMIRLVGGGKQIGIEIQSLSTDARAAADSKSWLTLPSGSFSESLRNGLHTSLSPQDYTFHEVGDLLRLVRLKLPNSSPKAVLTPVETDPRTRTSVEQLEQEKALFEALPGDSPTDPFSPEWERQRTAEESNFARSLGFAKTHTLAWSGSYLWLVLRQPLVLQLESSLWLAEEVSELGDTKAPFDNGKIEAVLGKIRSREPQNETEFLSLNYIRQKASLMLFLNLQTRITSASNLELDLRMTENALHEGGLDPRILLLMIDPLQSDVLQGQQGMWLHQGLADLVTAYSAVVTGFDSVPSEFWMMIKHYLTAWQDKRGYGSITDEKFVFDSVDAALLHVLLHLDNTLPAGSGAQTSTRAKLNNVVDHWKGDFNSAVTLLEQYKRLFVLSRLYQSKKLSRDVLCTWKRIIEGAEDTGGELSRDAIEIQMRRYLAYIRDANLVEEYAVWLAKRNPDLAIQVFTDDTSRVKFSIQQVTSLLKSQAPGAVQLYLEHLVFGKHLDQYADDLIGYYLDSVLSVLEHSEEARSSLAQTYSTYRALTPPKPTYLNFITENAPPEPWWQSRLRLLQLLGSGSYATSPSSGKELTYSIPIVLERLKPFTSFLVSESIILDARQGRHKEALRLLTHGLGDYDTAVRYCFFGGPSPASSQTIDVSSLPSREVQQDLFGYLFQEFLLIEDISERVERVSELIGKFAAFFDPMAILESLPESWSLEKSSEFFLRTFRAATSERNETIILKALSAAQNLQGQAEVVQLCEKIGATVERESGVGRGEPSASVGVGEAVRPPH